MPEPALEMSSNSEQVAGQLNALIKQGDIEVPLLPDVAVKVLTLSNDPNSDAAQLAKLIQGDQTLAAHVMRIANSAAYTPNASMVSLQQAIARLGMALISEIALAASVNTKMFKAPGFTHRIEDIWSHALCTGVWAKEISRAAKKNVEASFLCGLLHSIGRPVVLQSISETGIALSEDEALALESQFHIAFGAYIVKQWAMPTIVQETVKCYLDYEPSNSEHEQAMVVHCAMLMANATLWPDAYPVDEITNMGVLADLNLYEDEVERLLDQSDKVLAAMEAMRV